MWLIGVKAFGISSKLVEIIWGGAACRVLAETDVSVMASDESAFVAVDFLEDDRFRRKLIGDSERIIFLTRFLDGFGVGEPGSS